MKAIFFETTIREKTDKKDENIINNKLPLRGSTENKKLSIRNRPTK
jgi:hypothetical protein